MADSTARMSPPPLAEPPVLRVQSSGSRSVSSWSSAPSIKRSASAVRAAVSIRMPHHYDSSLNGGKLTWDAGSLIIDGRRVAIISGEFHYWRFPDHTRWESVLRSYKAAGLNAIRIYFHWGFHSPRPGVYRFDDNRDVDLLLRICERLGLYVLAAPGPYICAETSAGGFPFWLLEQRNVRIRHMQRTGMLKYDELFMSMCHEWWNAIVPILAAHEVTKVVQPAHPATGPGHRGCVVLFQVDNELFEKKIIKLGLHQHMYELSDAARKLGVTVPFFHDDGLLWGSWLGSSTKREKYSVDLYGFNLYVIFAPGSVWGGKPTDKTFQAWSARDFVKMVDSIEKGFRGLGRSALTSPIFIPELQVGWFNRWGLKQDFDDLYVFYGETFSLLLFASVVAQGCTMASMYTFCGGTNWGALPDPDVYTSYDYAAPLREYRMPSAKLHLLRAGVLQVVKAFEVDFCTARRVRRGEPLEAKIRSRDGLRPTYDGVSFLARQRESVRGVQICLLRNLAPGGSVRPLVLHLGGVHVRAQLPPRMAFFALGHVPHTNPYLLLSGLPILSHGRYGPVPANPEAEEEDGAAREDIWFVRCVPEATMCFQGHLTIVSQSTLPAVPPPPSVGGQAANGIRQESGSPMLRGLSVMDVERDEAFPGPSADAPVPEPGDVDEEDLASVDAGCLPYSARGRPRDVGVPSAPPMPAGGCVSAAHGHAMLRYPQVSPDGARVRLEARMEGDGSSPFVTRVRSSDEDQSAAATPASTSNKSSSLGMRTPSRRPPRAASPVGEKTPVTWLQFLQPCAVRIAAVEPDHDGPRRSAVVICLGEEEALSLVTFHSQAPGGVGTAPGSGDPSVGSFGACWGATSALFSDKGDRLTVTATSRQRVTVLPPRLSRRVPSPWAAPAWVRAVAPPHLAPGVTADDLRPVPPSAALGALAEVDVGMAPPAEALEVPIADWRRYDYNWDKLPWRRIDIKSDDERDSLYNGFNGGLSWYKAVFTAHAHPRNLRLKLNARHRVAIWCNGIFVGAETIYASAMLKAGAPNGPDNTYLGAHALRWPARGGAGALIAAVAVVAGSRTYPLHDFVRAGAPNELKILVMSFGQSR